MLELPVHIDGAISFRTLEHVYHAVTIPEDAVSILEEENLPSGWASRPVSRASQVVGDEWLDARPSPACGVRDACRPS